MILLKELDKKSLMVKMVVVWDVGKKSVIEMRVTVGYSGGKSRATFEGQRGRIGIRLIVKLE